MVLVKTPTGRLSSTHRKIHTTHKNGLFIAVVRSIREVMEIVLDWIC